MKILISSCLLGNKVRWNKAQKLDSDLLSWCQSNNIELIPVCPEDELFGTPRPPIKLIQIEENIKADMKSVDVSSSLEEKSKQIFNRHPEAVGFIGIKNSPSCGLSVGVRGHGKKIKGYMHRFASVPTDESSHMRNQERREVFLKRIKKYIESSIQES